MLKDPDRALARRARRGDRRALERLYERHRVPMFSLLVRMVRDRALAEDAFQEVWIKVMNGIEKFDPEMGNFKSWIGRITHNAAIDRLRRESRYSAAMELDAPMDESGQTAAESLVSEAPRPDRLAEVHEFGERLAELMIALPERHRAALLLRHQQGMSYAEIATVLGVPEGTAKTSVHRAVRALRDAWKESTP